MWVALCEFDLDNGKENKPALNSNKSKKKKGDFFFFLVTVSIHSIPQLWLEETT